MLKKQTKLYTAFSEYIVEGQIGQGGSGTVFRVHNSSNQQYALKAIDRTKASEEKLKRFKNEIVFCENNSDSNIISVLDHGAYNADGESLVFYVMPLYKRTLRMLMNEGIRPDERISIVTQILSGLQFAHKKRVWHRDIKPENILIDDNGKVIIADFGIAHFSSDDLATIVETKQSDRMANFQYAAPEQRVKNGLVDGRADIYSVGLILNEMFTNTLAIGSNYIKIRDVDPSYAWLDDVVDSMLQQNPEARPYPVSTLASHILAAKKDWLQSQELLRIAQEKTKAEGPYQMGPPTIRDAQYEDGQLKVFLDGIEPEWFECWFSIIHQGRYNHTARMGYETHRLKRYSPDCIAMPVSTSQKNQLNDIAKYIKSWIVEATKVFNQDRQKEYEREEAEQRRKKQEEIQRLKDEAEMRSLVKGLFE